MRSLVDDNPYEAAMAALYKAASEEQKARKAWGKGLLEALRWSDREADMSDERRWYAMHFVFGFFVFDQGMRGIVEGPRAVVDAVYGTIASYPLLVIAAWERMRSAEQVKELSYAVAGYLRTKLTTSGNRGTRLREAERTLRTLRADAALEAALLNTIAPCWEETKAAMSEAIKEMPISEAWEQMKEQATKDLSNASARHFEKAMEPFRQVESECDDTGQPVLSLDYQYDLEANDALSSTTLHNTPDPTAPDPQLALIRKERPEDIRRTVKTLRGKQRKFAELMLAGYDPKKDRAEMAKKLGVKKNQVSSLKGDVRKSLAPKLAGAAGNRKHSTCRIQPRENGKPHKHDKKDLYAVYDEGWDAYRKPYVGKRPIECREDGEESGPVYCLWPRPSKEYIANLDRRYRLYPVCRRAEDSEELLKTWDELGGRIRYPLLKGLDEYDARRTFDAERAVREAGLASKSTYELGRWIRPKGERFDTPRISNP